MAKIIFAHEAGTPPVPSAGTIVVYSKGDNILYSLDSTGLETPLTSILQDNIDFFEGNVPPDFANIDDYNFVDGAAFDPDINQDVIFRIDPKRDYQESGLKFVFRYGMSTAETGTVRLKLDYRVKNLGEDMTGGTDYQQLLTLDPSDLALKVETFDSFTIPASRITANTELVHCRFTRLATDLLDTHTGIFVLFGIRIGKL